MDNLKCNCGKHLFKVDFKHENMFVIRCQDCDTNLVYELKGDIEDGIGKKLRNGEINALPTKG